MVNGLFLAGIVGGSAIVVVAIVLLWHRRTRRQEALRRIQKLSKDIEYAMEERGTRHPQLVEHKIDAAEEQWGQGKYKQAERIMEDVFRIVQLS